MGDSFQFYLDLLLIWLLLIDVCVLAANASRILIGLWVAIDCLLCRQLVVRRWRGHYPRPAPL